MEEHSFKTTLCNFVCELDVLRDVQMPHQFNRFWVVRLTADSVSQTSSPVMATLMGHSSPAHHRPSPPSRNWEHGGLVAGPSPSGYFLVTLLDFAFVKRTSVIVCVPLVFRNHSWHIDLKFLDGWMDG